MKSVNTNNKLNVRPVEKGFCFRSPNQPSFERNVKGIVYWRQVLMRNALVSQHVQMMTLCDMSDLTAIIAFRSAATAVQHDGNAAAISKSWCWCTSTRKSWSLALSLYMKALYQLTCIRDSSVPHRICRKTALYVLSLDSTARPMSKQ